MPPEADRPLCFHFAQNFVAAILTDNPAKLQFSILTIKVSEKKRAQPESKNVTIIGMFKRQATEDDGSKPAKTNKKLIKKPRIGARGGGRPLSPFFSLTTTTKALRWTSTPHGGDPH